MPLNYAHWRKPMLLTPGEAVERAVFEAGSEAHPADAAHDRVAELTKIVAALVDTLVARGRLTENDMTKIIASLRLEVIKDEAR